MKVKKLFKKVKKATRHVVKTDNFKKGMATTGGIIGRQIGGSAGETLGKKAGKYVAKKTRKNI